MRYSECRPCPPSNLVLLARAGDMPIFPSLFTRCLHVTLKARDRQSTARGRLRSLSPRSHGDTVSAIVSEAAKAKQGGFPQSP
jgi:hypothetical protein